MGIQTNSHEFPTGLLRIQKVLIIHFASPFLCSYSVSKRSSDASAGRGSVRRAYAGWEREQLAQALLGLWAHHRVVVRRRESQREVLGVGDLPGGGVGRRASDATLHCVRWSQRLASRLQWGSSWVDLRSPTAPPRGATGEPKTMRRRTVGSLSEALPRSSPTSTFARCVFCLSWLEATGGWRVTMIASAITDSCRYLRPPSACSGH